MPKKQSYKRRKTNRRYKKQRKTMRKRNIMYGGIKAWYELPDRISQEEYNKLDEKIKNHYQDDPIYESFPLDPYNPDLKPRYRTPYHKKNNTPYKGTLLNKDSMIPTIDYHMLTTEEKVNFIPVVEDGKPSSFYARITPKQENRMQTIIDAPDIRITEKEYLGLNEKTRNIGWTKEGDSYRKQTKNDKDADNWYSLQY
jgi:hypothetical protein